MTTSQPLARTGRRDTATGRTLPYATKQDLLKPLIDGGLIEDEDDLLTNKPHLTQQVLRQWAASGHTSCLYADHLSPREDLWGGATLARALPQPAFDTWLGTAMTALAAKEIGLLTFPYVRTESDLAQMVGQVARSPGWWWEDRSRRADLVVPVALRWDIPGTEHVSWVLGFGPFEWIPFTRRAPYVALVMRTRPEAYTVPEERPDETGRRGAHLAHLPHDLEHGERGGRVWLATEGRKRTLLWDDLSAQGRGVAQACYCADRENREGQERMRDAWTVLAPSAKAKVTFMLQRAWIETFPAPGPGR